MEYINIKEKIKRYNKGIERIIQEFDITEDQIKAGTELCRIYDEILSNPSDEYYNKLAIFKRIASLLPFDYELVMRVKREENIVSVLEETLESHGICVYVDGFGDCVPNKYFALSDDAIYTWDDDAQMVIHDVEWEDISGIVNTEEILKILKENSEKVSMNRIKRAREVAGISRIQLAKLSGVPVRTIDDWENERRKPRDIYQIKKVADALNVEIEDIINFNEE